MSKLYRFTLALLALVGVFVGLGGVLSVQAQANFGTNWVAQFYDTPTLSLGLLTAPVSASFPNGVNANWSINPPVDGNGAPITGIPADNFSARFNSTQNFNAGTYNFTLTYDDGARLFINGQLVINDFVAGTLRTTTAQVTLSAGVVALVVEYVEFTNNAVVQLSWTQISGDTNVAPTATPVPPATGVVEGVRGLAVRTGPYLGASLVAVARPGNTYDILAKSNLEQPFTWYLIKISDTRQGWASGRYLKVTGDLAKVQAQTTIFEQLDDAPDTGVIGQVRSTMNMRVRPSQRTALIMQIPWGDTVQILNRTRQSFADYWYQVRYKGQVGWILASYVATRDSMTLVPIR